MPETEDWDEDDEWSSEEEGGELADPDGAPLHAAQAGHEAERGPGREGRGHAGERVGVEPARDVLLEHAAKRQVRRVREAARVEAGAGVRRLWFEASIMFALWNLGFHSWVSQGTYQVWRDGTYGLRSLPS